MPRLFPGQGNPSQKPGHSVGIDRWPDEASSEACQEDGTAQTFDEFLADSLHNLRKLLAQTHACKVAALTAEANQLRKELATVKLDMRWQRPDTPNNTDVFAKRLSSSSWAHKSSVTSLSSQVSCVSEIEADLKLHPKFSEQAATTLAPERAMCPSSTNESLSLKIKAGQVLRNESSRCWRNLVSSPLSNFQYCHNFTNLLFMLWDLVTIPLEGVGLAVETANFWDIIAFITTVWWTLDMLLNFGRGYLLRSGVVEMRFNKTAKKYLQSWFLVDLILVWLDWTVIIVSFTNFVSFFGMVRSVKLLRITRMVRLFRLVRLVRIVRRVPQLPHMLTRFVDRSTYHTSLTVGAWIVALVLVNHLIACFWYGLGSNLAGLPTWVQVATDAYMLNADEQPGTLYLYVTSLHWAFTMFTPASMEVVPENSYERVFTICTILVAIVCFSSFLSSISAAVALYRRNCREQQQQRHDLIRFLQQNEISFTLSARIQAYMKKQVARYTNVHRIHLTDVLLLQQLPMTLKEELANETFEPIISSHPLLAAMGDVSHDCIAAICQTAITQQSVLPMRDVYLSGGECQAMYFVVAGQMHYFEDAKSKHVNANEHAIVAAGSWACEWALLLVWKHHGQMATMAMPCELALLNAAVFQDVLQQWPNVKNVCREYAVAFTADQHANCRSCSDLPMPSEEVDFLLEQAFAASW